jgi:hypothetical protein
MKKYYHEIAEELGCDPYLLEPASDKNGYIDVFEALELANAPENDIHLDDFDDYADPDVHRVAYFEALEKVEKAKLLNLKRKQLEKELVEFGEVQAWIADRGRILRETMMSEINTIVASVDSGEDLRTLLKRHFTALLSDPFGIKLLQEMMDKEEE